MVTNPWFSKWLYLMDNVLYKQIITLYIFILFVYYASFILVENYYILCVKLDLCDYQKYFCYIKLCIKY